MALYFVVEFKNLYVINLSIINFKKNYEIRKCINRQKRP